jgi:hypothetical protein
VPQHVALTHSDGEDSRLLPGRHASDTLGSILAFSASIAKESSMSRGHEVESPNQVLSITTNIARGRDVLAALAAAWSSSASQLDPGSADDATTLRPHSEPRPENPTIARASR